MFPRAQVEKTPNRTLVESPEGVSLGSGTILAVGQRLFWTCPNKTGEQASKGSNPFQIIGTASENTVQNLFRGIQKCQAHPAT